MSIQHMQMVFDAGDLSGSEKAVLLAYCNHTDAHGYTWAGVERVADMTGFSEKTVKNVRKTLKERNLLRSSARIERSGRRKTDISRVNLTKLASLKLPPREYKDNVIAELEFEDEDFPETPADQPKGTTYPGPEQPRGSSCPRQGKDVPLQEGEAGAPNPSGEPSCEPSSSSASEPVEQPAPVAEPAPKKTKKTPEQIVQERTDATEDEARAVVDYVEQQGDAHGNRIRSLGWWLTNRDDRDLARDLAHVRRYAGKPGAEVCGLHKVPMAGDCSSCMGDIHAGDTDTVRAHLAEVGADARPDLAAVLGAPEPPAGSRSGMRGGTRSPLPSREEYAELATLTQDQLRDVMMGEAPPPARAPHGPVSRRQQETNDHFDRAMERARQREAAMGLGG